MEELNEVLNLNLSNLSLFDMTEDNLIVFKEENYYNKSNFYFWLLNKLAKLENSNSIKELAYGHYLASYYLLIILTPLCYEELAFNHCKKALALDDNLKYKEWMLIFSTYNLLTVEDMEALVSDVLKNNPNSLLVNTLYNN